METAINLIETLKYYGVGRRKLDDDIFTDDKLPARLGVYDLDDEILCHEAVKTTCNIPGCAFTAKSLLEYEDHYNSSHRYSCGQCRKMLPSPHLLDLHLQETHDSFFAVMSERKPSYCCYIEDCKEKFINTNDRHDHCVKVHKLPKDFRFEPKINNRKKNNETKSMDVEYKRQNMKDGNQLTFTNNKQKTFPKYTGRKFTKNNESKEKKDVEMEITVDELKKSLPE